MFSPIVPKELNFEKFYKNVWKLNFSYDLSQKIDEMRRGMQEVGLSAPGFFKNLLKNIANPFYHKEYDFRSNGSFDFVIPYDDFGNSLKELFYKNFGSLEVSSFPLYGAPNFQESTYISTLVYINGRPLTNEKYVLFRQYTVDIIVIPTKYLKDKDNVYIEQRRHWNKPFCHVVDKTQFDEGYDYIFDGAGLGTFYSADNGYVQQTKTTFCPSESKGDKFLNSGDYLLYYKSNGSLDEENPNSSSSWRIVPKEIYSISKLIDPNKETTLLKLSFNKEAVRRIESKEYDITFNAEKKVVTESPYFKKVSEGEGYFPEICKFIAGNDFLIENNSAQWEINIAPNEIPDPYSYSAIGNSVNDSVSIDITEGLIAYYPLKDDFRDYSINQNHIVENRSEITEFKTSDIDEAEVTAAYFDGSNYLFVNDSKTLHVNRSALTFTMWIKPESYNNGYLMLLSKYQEGKNFRPWGFYFNETSATDNSTGISITLKVARLDDAAEADNTTVVVNKVPEVNKWSHVALVCRKQEDNTLTLEVFINGESVGKAEGLTDTLVDSKDEDSPLTIGYDFHGVNEHFNGYMRQVRIYKKSLDADEIRYIMNIDKNNNKNTGIIKIAEKSHFNYIPLLVKKDKIDEEIVTKDHTSVVVDRDKGTKAEYLRNVREVDHEEYDTRDFRDIRPFSEEYKNTEESEMVPLPVSLAEELIVLVNENRESDEVEIQNYKSNFTKLFKDSYNTRTTMLNNINELCSTLIYQKIDEYMNSMMEEFDQSDNPELWINDHIDNITIENSNLTFRMYGPKYYEIVESVLAENCKDYDVLWSEDGENRLFTIKLSTNLINSILYENGASRDEMNFLNHRGWYFDYDKGVFEYEESRDETKSLEYINSIDARKRWYKLVPYVDYCLNEVDGKPVALRFFKHLKNGTSVRIIKIEPKNWFFFDGFFNTLDNNGIVVLDKYSDFPIDKAYLDCTINNQNVEKSLITNIADKAIHINAFDSTNLAYFRFAVPKNIDTWHFIDMYESFKTDLEKFFDSVGMYNDPTNVDETYEINGMKGLQFRVNPTISPSVYDYPTRFTIYQDDMIYGFVNSPSFRVVRYCQDQGCKYNDHSSNEYIGRHLEHDSDYVYNRERDAAEIAEYLHFFRLKDNTHRIPASEFKVVMEEGSREYNELYADYFFTTDSDGEYAIMSENPNNDGKDLSDLLYIKEENNKDILVFSEEGFGSLYEQREYDTDHVNPAMELVLNTSENPYNLSEEYLNKIPLGTVEMEFPEVTKTIFLNGGYDPKDLYDYANSNSTITKFIDDETCKEDENSISGINIRPYTWDIHNSVYSSKDDKKFGIRSLLFVGGYPEDNNKVYSYIDTDLKNLSKSPDEYNFTKENSGLLSISFWIKPEASRAGTAMGLVGDENCNFYIWIKENGHLCCRGVLTDGTTANIVNLEVPHTNLFNDSWNHCLFQIKDFGLDGKKAVLAVNGKGVVQDTEQGDNVLYINFFTSTKFCIGKGSEDFNTESYIGYLDNFEIGMIEYPNGDKFESTFSVVQNIARIVDYTVPEEDSSNLTNEEKLKYWSILNFMDQEWSDIDEQVVYQPNHNYGTVISRDIRVIENEFYSKGKYPLEVPALYFITKSSQIS